jgi:hypothetical protein
MNAHKKTVPGYAVNKSRYILSLSLLALLGTGPAFAADAVHCVHTIDYKKLSANEVEMLYRGIEVSQFTDEGATKGKCLAAIDYHKLSAEELEMQYRGIDVYRYTKDGAAGGKYVATIDYNMLSVEQLDRINKGIDVVVVGDQADKQQNLAALGR